MRKTIATVIICLFIGAVAGSKLSTPTDEVVRANYEQTGFKLPTVVGDVQIWFRHTPARDQFMYRIETEPGLARRFDLMSWQEHLDLQAMMDSLPAWLDAGSECWKRVKTDRGQDVWIPCDTELMIRGQAEGE